MKLRDSLVSADLLPLRGSSEVRQRERILSCYAVHHKEGWEAICLDFDIAVQGESFSEVSQKLGEALRSYIEYIMTLPAEDRARFLARRAPWHVRAKFVIGVVLTKISQKHDSGGYQSFGLPCTV